MKKTDKKTDEQQEVAPIKMVTVAILDAEDIFQGTQEISEAELTDAHIHLPNGCDLPIGKHRHDRDRKAFVALEALSAAEAEKPAPNATRAMAIGFIAMHEQGMALPPETLQWLDNYTASIDFLGSFSPETVQMVKNFNARKKG